jgi:hypothetical protein
MKSLRSLLLAVAMLVIGVGPALAVDTTRVYNSGILVLLFLGVCALIVVVQLIPAMVLLFGSLRSMFRGAKSKTATAKEIVDHR